MSGLERIATEVHAVLPNVWSELDAAASPKGSSFLTLETEDGFQVVVEWRPGMGFGISAGSEDGFGEGPDEVEPEESRATARVLTLVQSRSSTHPLRRAGLKQIRQLFGITQAELASTLDVKQSAVSRMEQRSDMYVSNLRRVIEALGGELEIVARFPDRVLEVETGR